MLRQADESQVALNCIVSALPWHALPSGHTCSASAHCNMDGRTPATKHDMEIPPKSVAACPDKSKDWLMQHMLHRALSGSQ